MKSFYRLWSLWLGYLSYNLPGVGHQGPLLSPYAFIEYLSSFLISVLCNIKSILRSLILVENWYLAMISLSHSVYLRNVIGAKPPSITVVSVSCSEHERFVAQRPKHCAAAWLQTALAYLYRMSIIQGLCMPRILSKADFILIYASQ